jgi:hypothetical protein
MISAPDTRTPSPRSNARRWKIAFERILTGSNLPLLPDGAAHDQRVDVARAFVGVHSLEIGEHPHHVELVGNAVAAVHVAGKARDLQRLAASGYFAFFLRTHSATPVRTPNTRGDPPGCGRRSQGQRLVGLG